MDDGGRKKSGGFSAPGGAVWCGAASSRGVAQGASDTSRMQDVTAISGRGKIWWAAMMKMIMSARLSLTVDEQAE